jgi:hypothetical protein
MAKVQLYTDNYDDYGQQVKAWLESHQLEYEVRDVADVKVWDELGEVSGQFGIPVVKAGAELIIGYDEERLEQVLYNKDTKKREES